MTDASPTPAPQTPPAASSGPDLAVNRRGILSMECILPVLAMAAIVLIVLLILRYPDHGLSEVTVSFVIATIAGLGGYVAKARQDFKNKLADKINATPPQ